ncbi:MAG: EamA family transporter [Bdellovibrionota bacterium]
MMLLDWRFFALGSAAFAALTAIFGKIGVSGINSNLATFIRTIIILVFTAAIISFQKEWKSPEELSGKALLFLTLSGLATGASWLCYYRALQLGPASKVAPVDKLSVVFVMILAFVFLGEAATWKTIVGAALIVAGSLFFVL